MLRAAAVLRDRRRKLLYERFLETTNGLAEASAGLSGTGRVLLGVSLLRIAETDRAVAAAVVGGSRIEEAVDRLASTRIELVRAGCDVAVGTERRRTLRRI